MITTTRQPVIRLAFQGNTQMPAVERRTGISRGLIIADAGRPGGRTGNSQTACHQRSYRQKTSATEVVSY
jgi:hypothetical protein